MEGSGFRGMSVHTVAHTPKSGSSPHSSVPILPYILFITFEGA